jgi:hypothetical protein
MDSSSKHTSPWRVAAVVSFYMFAALVVCPFLALAVPNSHPRSLDGLCVSYSLDLLVSRTLTCC